MGALECSRLEALRYFHRRQSDDEVTQKEKDMKCILLLEDDENLNRGISLKLSREGYHVFSDDIAGKIYI